MSEREPDKIVVAKNASPLILGELEEGGMLASDIPALLPYTRDVIIMEEGEMAVIDRSGIRMMSMSGELIERSSRRIDWSPVMAEKAGHKHLCTRKSLSSLERLEIHFAVVSTTMRQMCLLEPGLLERANQCNRIMLTACGTSWHSCLVGRMALEEMARIGCEVELASELRYRHPLLDENTLVVAVSQSGETADTLAAIREAKRLGSPVLSIVNVLDSSIARESDFVLYTHAGPEIGVASTKAF